MFGNKFRYLMKFPPLNTMNKPLPLEISFNPFNGLSWKGKDEEEYMVRYNYHDSLTSTFLAGGAPTSALAALVPLEADEWPLPLAVVAAAESPSSSRERFWPALAAGLSVTAGTWMTGTPLREQKGKKGREKG